MNHFYAHNRKAQALFSSSSNSFCTICSRKVARCVLDQLCFLLLPKHKSDGLELCLCFLTFGPLRPTILCGHPPIYSGFCSIDCASRT
jgi:hypothetical protein